MVIGCRAYRDSALCVIGNCSRTFDVQLLRICYVGFKILASLFLDCIVDCITCGKALIWSVSVTLLHAYNTAWHRAQYSSCSLLNLLIVFAVHSLIVNKDLFEQDHTESTKAKYAANIPKTFQHSHADYGVCFQRKPFTFNSLCQKGKWLCGQIKLVAVHPCEPKQSVFAAAVSRHTCIC